MQSEAERLAFLIATKPQSELTREDLDRVVVELLRRANQEELTPAQGPNPYENDEALPEESPAVMRLRGVPYCPNCYTFGHEHSRTCIYSRAGMAMHVRHMP